MQPMNADPIATLLDGSHLLVSTQFMGEGRFRCQLFVSLPCKLDKTDMRMVQGSDHEASTCREAQDFAYSYAMRRYPHMAEAMHKPPYLIWRGPIDARESAGPVEPHKRWQRHGR